MAISAARVSVDTDATLLYEHPRASGDPGDYSAHSVALINTSVTPATVALGDDGVTAATGARWIVEAGRTLTLSIEPGEALYGIVAAGSQDIDVLVGGR
jgi:hypothetical protein